MRLSVVFLCILSFAFLGPAQAETRTRLFADSDWTLDKINGFTMKDGRAVGKLDNMCVAETQKGGVTLTFAMNAREARVADRFRKTIFIQLSSPSWKFPFLETDFFLSSTEVFGVGDAWYFDDTVAFSVHVDDDMGLREFAETVGGAGVTITGDGKTVMTKDDMVALDGRGLIIATLSTKGLKSIYPKLIECAGQSK